MGGQPRPGAGVRERGRAGVAGRRVGTREIALRVSNGRVADTRLTVSLGSGGTREIECPLTVVDPQRPWVVVAIPDGRVGEGVEAFGTIATLREMGRPDAEA